MRIPVGLQNARLGAEFTRDLNAFELENSKEYSPYFESFPAQKHLKVDVKSDASSRILKSNGYIIPEKNVVASFDVHTQYTFTPECPNELPVPGGTEIVDELNAQARCASLRIGSKEAHHPKAIWVATPEHPQLSRIEGENVDVRWNIHSVPGTKGFELIAGLPAVSEYDYFVWQGIELDMHPYGACYHDFSEKLSTGAIEFLTCKNITTVLVGGLATDYCVKTTVLQLLRAGFNVVVNLGACRGIHPKTIEDGIDEMRLLGASFIHSASELIHQASEV